MNSDFNDIDQDILLTYAFEIIICQPTTIILAIIASTLILSMSGLYLFHLLPPRTMYMSIYL